MPWAANASAYAVAKADCPTDAAACRLGISLGRFWMPRASRPHAMAADVTMTGCQPTARTFAICSASAARYS